MKYLAVLVLLIITIVLLEWKKEYKGRILCGFILVMIFLGIVYNTKIISRIVPFYRPVNQTFYQVEFLEKGEYPDSFLPLLLDGRTVYTKDDRLTIEEAASEGKNWLYSYYHNENAINYMELAGAAVIPDEALNDSYISKEQQAELMDLGFVNDMFRYSFLCNDFWEELGNYFTYYWYYADYLPPIHVYMNLSEGADGSSIFDAEELVVLWDGSPENEAENLYIMTKDYYESEVLSWN